MLPCRLVTAKKTKTMFVGESRVHSREGSPEAVCLRVNPGENR